jgi:hypothetical protein
MRADRYLRFILTVIALELLWLGVREAAPPVLAQQQPMPVVITGFQLGKQVYTTLPVAVMGGVGRPLPSANELPFVEPLRVRVPDAVQVDTRQPLGVTIANQPVTVQTGSKPLAVDAIFKTGTAPGL